MLAKEFPEADANESHQNLDFKLANLTLPRHISHHLIDMGSNGAKPKILLLGNIDQCVLEKQILFPDGLLLIRYLNSAKKSWDALSELGELVEPTAKNRTEFIQECRDGKLDGVVAAYRTFTSVDITGLIDEELVNALPSSLKYLAHCGKRPPKYSENNIIRQLRYANTDGDICRSWLRPDRCSRMQCSEPATTHLQCPHCS